MCYTPPRMFFRGQIIGKYKILSTIGSGGFGTVYLAEDTWIDKKVALKVPHKQGVDFGELLREPRLLASLNHPNIVTILTAEKQENVFFIVMEFVPGETLETIIARDGALDLPRALDYTCQICNAVDHAHRQGVLHRDLRPSNVLVADSGMLKVADFGTSRFLEIAAHGTTVIGSPPYMAPEQFQGKAVFASDIYSLGVTMYQMLTGVLPYDTPSPADLDRLMRGELRHAAAPEEPEDPEGDQRHRAEGDGAGDPRALPARGRAARRRAGRAAKRRCAAHAAADAAAGRAQAIRRAQDIQTRLQGARSAAAALLLALPQAAARPLRSLPVLRRSAVDVANIRRFSQRSSEQWLSGHRQDLDERQAGGLEGRDHPHRLARHPLRQRRLRRRALLRDAEGLGLLPARRAHAPAAALRQDLPDGVPARPRRLARTPCSTRSARTR